METEKRTCPQCGNEFEGKANKKFCSNTCRSKASLIRMYSGTNGLGTAPPTVQRPVTSGPTPLPPAVQDPASQFIISQLTRERDKLETQLDDEKKLTKTLKEKLEAEIQAHKDFKTQTQIEGIKNEKPGGLNGLLQQPIPDGSLGARAIEAAAPAIQSLIERMTSAQGQGQIAGAPTGSPMAALAQWFDPLPLDVKQNVWKLFQALTIMPNDGEDGLKAYSLLVADTIMKRYPQQEPQQQAANQ